MKDKELFTNKPGIKSAKDQCEKDSNIFDQSDLEIDKESTWDEKDHLYIHYLYKITNKNNGKYYIGIHSIKKSKQKTQENDNYYGSGTEIRKAIKKEGKENFTKEILKIFSTRNEARSAEKEAVTIDVVKDPMSYNKIIGGGECTCGKISVRLVNGEKYMMVDLDEYNKNKDLYLTASTGKIIVEFLDTNGNRSGTYGLVDKNDSRYLSGKCVPITKGRHLTEEQKLNISGENNSRFKTRWITNGHESKVIKDKENIPNGWKFGRTIGTSNNLKKKYKNINTGEISYYSDEEYKNMNDDNIKLAYLFDKNEKYISKERLITIINELGIKIINNSVYFDDLRSISNYLELYKETVKRILEYYNIKVCRRTTNKELERYCEYCGKRIVSQETHAKFCSLDCFNKYQKLNRGKHIPSKEELISKFEELKSSKEVSNYYSVGTTTINNWVRRLGIRKEINEIIKSTKRHSN